MTHTYPYTSKAATELLNLTEGIDYAIWRHGDVQELVTKANGQIVEIGGPSEDGFHFLDGVVLPSEVVITNLSDAPSPHSPLASELASKVTQRVDGRKMPYADDSIGIFLMAFMSLADDSWLELDDDEKEKQSPVFEATYAKARLEMGQVAAGHLPPPQASHAQRIQIYREVHRCLAQSGLFFTDGGIEEIVILQKMGFQLVAALQRTDGGACRYEVVMTKL